MTVKTTLYTIFLSIVTLYAVGKLWGGLNFTGGIEYIVLFWLGWGVVNLAVPYLTTFVTLPKQFLWLWLVNSILGALYLIFVPQVLPGVTLEPIVLPANTFFFVQVSRFVFVENAVAVILSMSAAFLHSLFKSLQSTK